MLLHVKKVSHGRHDSSEFWSSEIEAGCDYGQMEGPSPLLPAWLDYWLQPSRAAWNRGLKSGASPLLLPPSTDACSGNSRHQVEDFITDNASSQVQQSCHFLQMQT